MNRRNPFTALYYIKENKGRSALCIFMMVLATFMFLAGNYIQSAIYSFEEEFSYSDRLVVVSLQSTDTDFRDFQEFREAVMADEKLQFVDASAMGFSGLQHSTVLGLQMGGFSYVFHSVSDMEKVFAHLGIRGDFSDCKHRSMILSKEFAANRGIRLGDHLDHSFDSSLDREYTLDAVTEGGGYCTFFVYEDDESLGRLYVYSDEMQGKELYDYVRHLAGARKVHIDDPEREMIMPQFDMFYGLFYMIDFLIAVVLAVTVYSVVTGHYFRRTYEFGVYRALGISRKAVKRKVAAEILTMNGMACVIGFGAIVIFTYLMNEMVYQPNGLELLVYSVTGFAGFVLCDLLIVLPLIVSKGALMARADVTEF